MAVTITTKSEAKKDRSPSFPFIPLNTAVGRLEAFEKKFGRHPAPAGKVGLAWEMKEKSSQADQTLAALKSFGLVNYEGSGESRVAVLTDEGRNYLRAQQEATKKQILKQCALRPKVIRKFWTTWGPDRPPDEVALDTLVLHSGFTPAGARTFLTVYDDTVAFAGLSASDKVPEEEENGALPVPNLSPEAARILNTPPNLTQPPAAKSPMLQEIFSLDEGPVTLSFPSAMSPDSYQDLAAHLEIFLRKAKRRAEASRGSAATDDPEITDLDHPD